MKKVTYKCDLSIEKRPKWLRLMTSALNNLYSYPTDGSLTDFQYIKRSLDRLIYNMNLGIGLRSDVTTQIVEDSNQTVLFIKRGGRILVSIYIK